jgi:hypothetical protein
MGGEEKKPRVVVTPCDWTKSDGLGLFQIVSDP